MRTTDPEKLPPHLKIKYIVEVMKMRERGRKKLLEASKRRRTRKLKKSSTDWHTSLGLIDDSEYGEKPKQMKLREALSL